MKTMTREDAVREFRSAAKKTHFLDQPEDSVSVWKCLYEEFNELDQAASDYIANPTEETRANFVKEWADAQYVLSQVAVYYMIPGQEAFNRVHNSNMTKVASDGEIKYREDGKILKPDNYVAPDMKGL